MSENGFTLRDVGSLHRYRTEIPNIIYHLGLDIEVIGFYTFLKKVAGDEGDCYMTIPNIAKKLGCSENKIRDYKKILSKPFPLINNQSLIIVEKIKKPDGNNAPDNVKITNIWPINMYLMSQIGKPNPNSNVPPHAASAPPPPGSESEPIRRTIEEEPFYKKTTNPTLPPSPCNKKLSDLVGGFSSIEEKKANPKPYACLIDLPLSEKDKMRITEMFSEDLVRNAVAFCLKKQNKITKMDGSIIYYCKNPHHITESKEEIEQKKQKEYDLKQQKISHRKRLTDALSRNLHKFCMDNGKRIHAGHAGSDYVEIESQSSQEKIYYDNDRFKGMIEHVLRKFEFPIPAQFLECLV